MGRIHHCCQRDSQKLIGKGAGPAGSRADMPVRWPSFSEQAGKLRFSHCLALLFPNIAAMK